MEEKDLIQGSLNGNPLYQRLLFNQLAPKMLPVCARYASCKDDAEDMLQEGFIKVFTHLHTYQGTGAFDGWVRRIMVHTSINFLKKNKKFSEYFDLNTAEYVQETSESIPSIMRGRQILECMKKLPFGYRTVLNLYAIEGYSHKEIGALLEIGESTSRSQYTRAKSLLEKILVKEKIVEDANLQLA